MGGPIRKDKTFFFGSFQGLLPRQATTTITSVPVQAWRNGDFSGVPRLEIYDPPTGKPDGTGRQRFANNQIMAGRTHPISRALVALIPQHNQPGFAPNLPSDGAQNPAVELLGRVGANNIGTTPAWAT